MRYRRVFIQRDEIVAGKITLSKRNAHYVCTVLRHRRGDMLRVLDGRREYLVRLSRCRPDEVLGDIIETTGEGVAESPEIVLACSCVRPGPMDEILRHGTELGVSRFIPLLTRRCHRMPKEKKDRWEKVVAGAVAQSGRPALPRLEAPMFLKDFLTEAVCVECTILLVTSPEGRPVLRILDDFAPSRVVILVGPEGGFTPEEENEAAEAGFVSATLGPRVLRTETAAITAVGIVSAWYEFRCTDDLSAQHS